MSDRYCEDLVPMSEEERKDISARPSEESLEMTSSWPVVIDDISVDF